MARSAPAFLPLADVVGRRLDAAAPGRLRSWSLATGVAVPAVAEASLALVVRAGVLARLATSAEGRTGLLELLLPGDLFGRLPVPGPDEGESGPTATVRALVPSTLLALPAHVLAGLTPREPEVARWVLERLAVRLQRAHRALEAALTLPVRERVHAFLARLAEEAGRPHPAGVRVAVPLTQDAIACAVGATRESVNRALADLAAEGTVRRSGRIYLLPGTTRAAR